MKIQNNLIDSALQAGIEKFIFFGSSCFYRKLALQPLKEEYLLTGNLEPTNECYAIAKIKGANPLKKVDLLKSSKALNSRKTHCLH